MNSTMNKVIIAVCAVIAAIAIGAAIGMFVSANNAAEQSYDASITAKVKGTPDAEVATEAEVPSPDNPAAEAEAPAKAPELPIEQRTFNGEYISVVMPASWTSGYDFNQIVQKSIQNGQIPTILQFDFTNKANPAQSFTVYWIGQTGFGFEDMPGTVITATNPNGEAKVLAVNKGVPEDEWTGICESIVDNEA